MEELQTMAGTISNQQWEVLVSAKTQAKNAELTLQMVLYSIAVPGHIRRIKPALCAKIALLGFTVMLPATRLLSLKGEFLLSLEDPTKNKSQLQLHGERKMGASAHLL